MRTLLLSVLLVTPAPETAFRSRLASAGKQTVALTRELIRFPTVSDAPAPQKKAAFGAMAKFLQKWAQTRGFEFRVHGDNDVFEIVWGPKEERAKLGFLMHGDVVRAPRNEWKFPPFTPTLRDGRLYGRGAEDDKGPIAAALVAMDLARQSKLTPKGPIVVIIGNGEESDWTGMRKYAETQTHPEHIISVDSGFPVVFGESGFVSWKLAAPLGSIQIETDAPVAIDVRAGEFLTQVPGQASVTLTSRDAKALETQVREAVTVLEKERSGFRGTVSRKGQNVTLVTHGKAVHAASADEGRNALWDLAAATSRLGLASNGIRAVLDTVMRSFDGDLWGEKLGLAHSHPRMGKLLVTANVLRMKEGQVELDVNLRRPAGKERSDFEQMLTQAAQRVERESEGKVKEVTKDRFVSDPAMADVDGPLAKTLLSIYRELANAPEAAPISIRGGTYARLFPGAVNFGPAVPNEPYMGHAADEYIRVDHLQFMTRALGEALVRLAL